jgi:hypothetical protein
LHGNLRDFKRTKSLNCYNEIIYCDQTDDYKIYANDIGKHLGPDENNNPGNNSDNAGYKIASRN